MCNKVSQACCMLCCPVLYPTIGSIKYFDRNGWGSCSMCYEKYMSVLCVMVSTCGATKTKNTAKLENLLACVSGYCPKWHQHCHIKVKPCSYKLVVITME